MSTIRLATLDDIPVLVAHRRAMFEDMGYKDGAQLSAMAAAFEPWLRKKMRLGEYVAFVAVDPQGAPAAGLGLWLMDWPPHVVGRSQQRANILNVYTRRDSRRQGHARRLMQAAIDWCRARGIDTIVLHASPDGRALYESPGFAATNEMRLVLG
jgi:ribosomal protein S18 acetylase RimI-like enzyme